MSQLNLKHVTKSYDGYSIIPDLSLEVKRGEFLSLLGPSGCGKTTLLRMIAGLEKPSSGQIWIENVLVSDPTNHTFIQPEHRGLGMVFQSYAIWPHMTVLENVLFPLQCKRVPKKDQLERSMAALASVKLAGYEQRKPHQLSGGQQQRVALARALVSSPKILLLDEPLSNLDALLREEMCEELKLLKKNSPITMIYVTHDQKEAFLLSDRIALLDKGKIEQLGTPNEVKTNPSSDFVKQFLKLQY